MPTNVSITACLTINACTNISPTLHCLFVCIAEAAEAAERERIEREEREAAEQEELERQRAEEEAHFVAETTRINELLEQQRQVRENWKTTYWEEKQVSIH